MDFLDTGHKRIAIVADWLIDFGGAELVISHLLEMYPEADIFTSVCYMDNPMLAGRRVYTSWLQKVPFLNRRHKLAGILRPWAFRSFDLSEYDLVICSSSAESKQVAMGKWKTSPQPSPAGEGVYSTHSPLGRRGFRGEVVCYCHTPIRYYWSHYEEYLQMMEFGFFNPLARAVLKILIGWLRRLDYEAAQRVDIFIANSKTTQERIEKYYHRDSVVIYPGIQLPSNTGQEEQNGGLGVETVGVGGKTENGGAERASFSTPNSFGTFDTKSTEKKQDGYYISVGRCIPYKKFDLLVDTFNQNGKHLILCTATDTTLYRELKEKSKPNIEWRFRVSNEEKNALIAGARAFLFPPLEDFGLVPVEAMSLGTPVIAYGVGGATETVIDSETGALFTPQTPEALDEAIKRFETMAFDPEKIRIHAEEFSKERFQKKIHELIKKYE